MPFRIISESRKSRTLMCSQRGMYNENGLKKHSCHFRHDKEHEPAHSECGKNPSWSPVTFIPRKKTGCSPVE